MLTSASQRLIVPARAHAKQIRLISSMPSPPQKKEKEDRRSYHTSTRRESEAAPSQLKQVADTPSKTPSALWSRMVVTAEVTVSKIFPAGFGWQTGSIVAENNFGFAPETMNFAMTTGVGDAFGVLAGHMTYYAAKKAAVDSEINLTQELHTGILLGSAAFCSGTAWQPLVNALQGANLSFNEVFFGTWAGCGLAFYGGLRVGRTILSGYLEHIQEPTFANSQQDAALSVAIGGATGFFVGTDAAYLPEQNFLIKAVGIADGTPDITGCAIAGASTSLGFMSAQTSMNMIYPAKKCWND